MIKISKILSQCEDFNYMALYGWQNEFGGDEYIQFGYIKGYITAAGHLIEYAVETNQQDYLIFPIAFNYRQYLELLLKYICRINQNDYEYKKTIKETSHSLKLLLKKVLQFSSMKDYIEMVGIDKSEQLFIKKLIIFFDKYDKGSFNFRFPLDKQLNNSIKLGKKKEIRINMKALKEIMEYFDGIFFQLYASKI